MRHTIGRYVLGTCLAVTGLVWNGEVAPNSQKGFVTTAQALIGAPATPLSYAGVARRTTVRAVTPGVGYGGVGGPASGVGVLPGAGAGAPGVGVGGVGNYPGNRGGPVNRVGRR
jgi:hypothetical protein